MPVDLIDPEGPTLPEGEPDPATAGRRAELAAAILAAAIRRYGEASEAWTAVAESYPHLPGPRAPADDAERRERRAWMALRREADAQFDAAEQALADAIGGLYDLLAPEGRRARDADGDYFVPRAVRHGGYVYVLADNPGNYEPHSNLVAVYHEGMAIDLDGGPDGDDG